MKMTPRRFAAIRAALGLTQGELADLICIARPYCNAIENGKRTMSPQIAMVMDALSQGWRPPPTKAKK